MVRTNHELRDFRFLANQVLQLRADAVEKRRLASSELASAAKFSDQNGKLAASTLSPDVVVTQLHSFLLESKSAIA
jgi:hypothetical protein